MPRMTIPIIEDLAAFCSDVAAARPIARTSSPDRYTAFIVVLMNQSRCAIKLPQQELEHLIGIHRSTVAIGVTRDSDIGYVNQY